MDLREVLAATLCDAGCTEEEAAHEATAVLARLSRPDVLDEFEQRVIGVTTAPSAGGPMAPWVVARRVLSDMLGGGS